MALEICGYGPGLAGIQSRRVASKAKGASASLTPLPERFSLLETVLRKGVDRALERRIAGSHSARPGHLRARAWPFSGGQVAGRQGSRASRWDSAPRCQVHAGARPSTGSPGFRSAGTCRWRATAPIQTARCRRPPRSSCRIPGIGRLLIAVAGPAANLVTALLVMVVVGMIGVSYPDYPNRLGATPDTSVAYQRRLARRRRNRVGERQAGEELDRDLHHAVEGPGARAGEARRARAKARPCPCTCPRPNASRSSRACGARPTPPIVGAVVTGMPAYKAGLKRGRPHPGGRRQGDHDVGRAAGGAARHRRPTGAAEHPAERSNVRRRDHADESRGPRHRERSDRHRGAALTAPTSSATESWSRSTSARAPRWRSWRTSTAACGSRSLVRSTTASTSAGRCSSPRRRASRRGAGSTPTCSSSR